MMSMPDIRRAILGSQPAAVNRLARSLHAAFLREAGADGDWRAVARLQFETMAAAALGEECALGERGAMAFVSAALGPIAGLARLYREASEPQLTELTDLIAAFGSAQFETDVLRRAAAAAKEDVLGSVLRPAEPSAGSMTAPATAREPKAALRRLYCLGVPALRLDQARDAARWIGAQAADWPLPTLARTPYEEMLPREMDLLESLVSAYMEEAWFRDMRCSRLFAAVPPPYLAFPASVLDDRGREGGGGLLRALASALLVPPLERLDLVGDETDSDAPDRTVVETGRRIADWADKVLATDPSADGPRQRRPALERLRTRHAAARAALMDDLRGRCADAARSV